MNKRTLLLFIALAPACAKGQTRPTPPFVAFPAGSAAWSVEVSLAPGAPPILTKSVHPVKIEVARDGHLTMCRWTWSDGSVNEDWINAKYLLLQDRSSKGIRICNNTAPSDDPTARYNLPDETLLRWVQANAFAGIAEQDGKDCFHYKAGGAQAWVERRTHLPVELDLPGTNETYTYTFMPPSAQPLTLPPPYANVLLAMEKYLTPPKGLSTGTLPPP